MSKYLATNQNRPCPICDKTNGNCRSIENDLILCMSFADAYNAVNDHPDYRYTKPTKDGRWGIYAPRNDNDFDQEKWEREKWQREIDRDRSQSELSKTALSIESRDAAIRSILGQLSLSEGDRALLHRRGLTDEQIEILGYRSVEKWQPLQGTLSYAVNRLGNLNNPTDGILVPIPDHLGRYIALRLHNPDGRPKYQSFKGSHLKSGEFPIAVYGPEKAQGMTWITEGLEFKPALTSLRFDGPAIGHNGSNFTSSPLQEKEALEALGTHTVLIPPDGGVVNNPNLVSQYQNAIAQYQAWGYNVLIPWWGQFTKADGDIDEIGPEKIAAIQYLTPEQFWQLCPTQNGKICRFKDWVGKQLERVKPKGFGVPKIEGTEFDGDHAIAWQEVNGDVLDSSSCGSGKSHSVADIENPYGKIWYVYGDHRNPTIEAIANDFTDLIPRHQYGFYRDDDGKLKKADKYTPENLIEIEGNCIRAGLFPQLTNLGHDPNSGGSQNPICQSCQMLKSCGFMKGHYLNDRRETLKADKIRCHIESMPREWDYSNDIVIWDEPSRLFNPTKVIETNWGQIVIELDRVRGLLSSEQYQALDKALQALKPLFDDKTRYGLKHQKIIESLGEINLSEDILTAIAANPLDLTKVFPRPDEINEKNPTVAAYFRNEAYQASQENLKKVPPNALIHLLKALNGGKGISLRIAYGTLSITLDRRSDYAQIVNGTKQNIFLDATMGRDRLIQNTGLNRPLTVIRSKSESPKNQTVTVIKTEGFGSKQITDKAINRGRLILQTLGEQYGDFPLIAPKQWGKDPLLDIDGHWFNHNRGVNDFAGLPNLASVSLPRPNVGAVEDEFYALNGTLDSFEEHYDRLVNEEILQWVGRQRANRYPGQEFNLFMIVPPSADLSWLADYGYNVVTKTAFEIHPEAGTETQTTRYHILQTVKECLDKGITTTQAAIAAAIGKTQQAVSHSLKRAGLSLHQLTQMIEDLLPDSYTNQPNNPNKRGICMTDWLYGDFALFFDLPIDAIAHDAITTIETYGLDYFWEYLSNFPKALQAKYLTVLRFIITNDENLTLLNLSQ